MHHFSIPVLNPFPYEEIMGRLSTSLLTLAIFIKTPCIAQEQLLQTNAMLFQAEEIARTYAAEMAVPSPSTQPLRASCLQTIPTWLTIHLSSIELPSEEKLFPYLAQWLDPIRELGITALYLKELKKPDTGQSSLFINPFLGTEAEFLTFSAAAQEKGISIITDLIGPATGISTDFFLALQNVSDYPSLYCLIEIDAQDWGFLPIVGQKELAAPLPWLSLQHLHKKKYVPEPFSPYNKQSDWNATGSVVGMDGKSRRWVYLKDSNNLPLLNWITPSFASERLAAGDALQSIYRLGCKLLTIHKEPQNVIPLLRKMGAFSALKTTGGFTSFLKSEPDLFYDHITPTAFLHALITEDAAILRLMYKNMLEKMIQPKQLIHSLKPLGKRDYDWAEFKSNPKQKYIWKDQSISGELLIQHLWEQELLHLKATRGNWPSSVTWANINSPNLSFSLKQLQKRHELMALAFAMQPGVFSIDVLELTGGSFDLLNSQEAFYSKLPNQLKNPRSFASQIKKILQARRDYFLEEADLIDIPNTSHPGLFIQLYQTTNGYFELCALNFSREPIEEIIDLIYFKNTSAINVIARQTEEKVTSSRLFHLKLDGWSGKIILFQSRL
jgi:hypothetical protein